MHKFITLLLILLIAPIFGGIYGILHDQITYTISEEYYTKFKFVQFGLSEDYWAMGRNIGTEELPEIQLRQPRLGVSVVGVMATWWVGMIIGVLLGLLGLIHKTGKKMLVSTIKAFVLTIGVALLTGMIGLGYGKFFLIDSPPSWFLPKNLIDIDSFIMVGSMHNFSYLGGLLGLIAGIVYSIRQKRGIKLN